MGRLTKVIPKELLPFGKKFALDFLMEELERENIRDVVVIINQKKKIIKDYLLSHYRHFNLSFLNQNKPLGLAHAYSLLKNTITTDFIVLFPDHLAFGNVLGQMISFYENHKKSETAPFILKGSVVIPPEESRFSTGKPPKAVLNYRSTGRTIYPPEFLNYLPDFFPEEKEVNEKVPERSFARDYPVISRNFEGTIWDIGTLEGYLFYLYRHLGEELSIESQKGELQP